GETNMNSGAEERSCAKRREGRVNHGENASEPLVAVQSRKRKSKASDGSSVL
ncbi:hypothetical protein HAX54_050384, partial [Datura stramonium]|nr:hypothetical protein [Datura stramonium]